MGCRKERGQSEGVIARRFWVGYKDKREKRSAPVHRDPQGEENATGTFFNDKHATGGDEKGGG